MSETIPLDPGIVAGLLPLPRAVQAVRLLTTVLAYVAVAGRTALYRCALLPWLSAEKQRRPLLSVM